MVHGPSGGSTRPFGRLADPSWAANMAFVKDASALDEVRRRFDGNGGGKGNKDDGMADKED